MPIAEMSKYDEPIFCKPSSGDKETSFSPTPKSDNTFTSVILIVELGSIEILEASIESIVLFAKSASNAKFKSLETFNLLTVILSIWLFLFNFISESESFNVVPDADISTLEFSPTTKIELDKSKVSFTVNCALSKDTCTPEILSESNFVVSADVPLKISLFETIASPDITSELVIFETVLSDLIVIVLFEVNKTSEWEGALWELLRIVLSNTKSASFSNLTE